MIEPEVRHTNLGSADHSKIHNFMQRPTDSTNTKQVYHKKLEMTPSTNLQPSEGRVAAEPKKTDLL